MEESLKARLIGAVVLVALAVLLIPELLSGRKPPAPVAEEAAGPSGTRTFTIELGQAPGQPSHGPATSAAPVAAPSTPSSAASQPVAEPAPAPAEAEAAAPLPRSTPPSGAAAPAAVQRAEPAPTPAPGAAGGGWAVQVGAFGSNETARKLQRDLGAAGYRAFVSPVNRAGTTLYRVRVGPVGDRAGAEQLVPRLKARGLPATVVQNE